jgi:protein tyrosine/serine phosphatase
MDTSNSYQFDNLLNFRDVGANINAILGKQVLRPGVLYRSARPDEASQSDRDQLVKKYKIKTIIDLRSKTEHINAAKKRSALSLAQQSAAVPSSARSVEAPVQIPGINYINVNLNGKGFERYLIWQLKYTSLAKLVFLMALGYRSEGISILGKELMLPRGLTGLGIDTLDHSGPEVKEVFDTLANNLSWPIMINCTQGKDRTGVTVLLVLLLCNIDTATISQDYMKSEPELEPEKATRMEEISSIGLDESFAGCPADFCEKIVQHLKTRYGGVEKYLESIGVEQLACARIRKHMLYN